MSDQKIAPIAGGARPKGSKRRPIIAKVRALNAVKSVAVAPDDDVAGWHRRLKDLLATSSPLSVEAILQQLMAASKLPGEPAPSTTSLSAALEVIASLEPENEAQAALAIHIACLHAGSLNVLSRMHGVTERNLVAVATAAAKLERAFQAGMETYGRMKSGVTQIVRVERVDIQAGAQAVIGLAPRP